MQTEVSTFIGKNHQNLGFKKKKKSLREVNTPNTYMIHQFLSSQMGEKGERRKSFDGRTMTYQ